jgi:hypothetical protein
MTSTENADFASVDAYVAALEDASGMPEMVAARIEKAVREEGTQTMTSPARYRKKPVEIDAMQVTEKTPFTAVAAFVGQDIEVNVHRIVIHTLEGDMHVSPGDWIIRGVKGEFYPCKPDIFAASYEPVDGPKP